jgi:cytochrome c-type biogenesis protein
MENLGVLIEQSPLLAVAAAFLGGVVVSFTITLGVIGARSGASRCRGFTLSAVYVLGMAITYAALGAFAAVTGKLFGQLATSPWTYFVVGNASLLFGLAMLDVIHLPQVNIAGQASGQPARGLLGTFFFGAVAGLVVGPCTAPVLATLLVFVGSQQNLLYGFVLLLAFGYGVGFLLIVLGTFAGLLTAMPRSGLWMERIKKSFGWLMLGVAEYFLILMGEALV